MKGRDRGVRKSRMRKLRGGLMLALMLMICAGLPAGCGSPGEDEGGYDAAEDRVLSDSSCRMGLEAVLSQDASEYGKEDAIGMTLDLYNDTGFCVSSVSVHAQLPAALRIVEGERSFTGTAMNVGTAQSFELILGSTPLGRRALGTVGTALGRVFQALWNRMKANPLIGVAVLAVILLFILIAAVLRAVSDRRLQKQGLDPKTWRKERRKEKKARKKEARKETRARKKAERKEKKNQKKYDKEERKAKVRQEKWKAEHEPPKKGTGDSLKSILALLICGAAAAGTLALPGGTATARAAGPDTPAGSVSEDYSMEVSHSVLVEGREYTVTLEIDFTLTMILNEGEVPDDPYREEALAEAMPTEIIGQFDFEGSDLCVSALTVDAVTDNGTGEIALLDGSETSPLIRIPGLVGSPAEILLVGDTLEEATITFSYDAGALRAAGIDENNLGIVWYNESAGEPVLMEESTVDTEAHTVSLVTTHFSQYAVVDTDAWYDSWRKVQYVSRGGTADFPEYFNIVLTIDHSGSMQGEKNELSKEAACKFIRELEDNDLFSVIAFNTVPTTLLQSVYSGDLNEDVQDAVMSLGAGGGTDFDSALLEAISLLDSMGKDRKYTPYYEEKSYVSGTVTDADGNPLGGVTVNFYIQEDDAEQDPETGEDQSNTSREDPEPDYTLVTGDDGSFSIECSSACYLRITYEREGCETRSLYLTTSAEKEVDASVSLNPEGEWYELPLFASGGNGLYSTADLIIFLSDGQSTISESTYEALEESGCRVIVIGLGSDVKASVLKELAARTGGVYIYTSDASMLDTVYEVIWGLYIGVSPEDTDSDGIPDAVEIAGMKNQYGSFLTTDPDHADTDGDGYSDSAEMGVYDDEKGLFIMKSDPTVPSYYSSEASIRFTNEGCVNLASTDTAKSFSENTGDNFSVSVCLSADAFCSESDSGGGQAGYETIYASPTNLVIWAEWTDSCLDAGIDRFSVDLSADGISTVSRSFYFGCSGGGVSCGNDHIITIHAKADNAGEITLTVKAGEKVQEKWLTLAESWLAAAEKTVCQEGTEFIEDFVSAIDRTYTGEEGLDGIIDFPDGSTFSDKNLEEAVRKWVLDDYLSYIDAGYQAGKTGAAYDAKSARSLIKSILKTLDLSSDETADISVGTKTCTFNVHRSVANGIFWWVLTGSEGEYQATTDYKTNAEALASYLNDLQVLGASVLEECRSEILSVKGNIKGMISLLGLKDLYDGMDGNDIIKSALDKIHLGSAFDHARSLYQYYDKASSAVSSCRSLGAGNISAEDITGVLNAVYSYLTFIGK